jgi:hypothetical protein
LQRAAFSEQPFARVLPAALPTEWIYVSVDGLIFIGIIKDWIFTKRIHAVYRCALLPLILGQTFALYIATIEPPWWLRIAHGIIG